jgi:hypothetical protein
MIAIVNVDSNARQTGLHQYELRINNHVVARFVHHREEPLHECLLRAAIAAEEKATPRNGLVRPFLEPRYDEVFFKGLEYLASL